MMLRTCLRPLVLTAAAVFAFGAFPAQAQDGAAPVPVTPAGEKIKLETNFAKDQAFDLVIKTTANQNMNLGGMEITSDIDMSRTETNKIESVDDAGMATMKTKVGRITGSFASPMAGQFDFDSDKQADETGNPMLDGMLRSLVADAGKETVAKIEKNGSKITGGTADDATTMRAMASVQKLPKDPVGVGDAWTHESSGPLQGATTKTKVKYTVKALDADTVTVTHDGTFERSESGEQPGGGGNPLAALMARMKLKSTKISGESKISRKDGYVIASDVTIVSEMELAPDENSQDPMSAAGGTMINTLKVHQERKPATADKPAPDKAAPVTPSEPEKK